jgi:hypothetical protein
MVIFITISLILSNTLRSCGIFFNDIFSINILSALEIDLVGREAQRYSQEQSSWNVQARIFHFELQRSDDNSRSLVTRGKS